MFRSFIRLFLFPLVFYLFLFLLLTFPAILKFSTYIFADGGDGLQNYWNLWWVNKAIIQLHQNPWFTTYIHYPYGVTLIGHSLNIFNGLLGVILLRFLTLTQTYNFIVIFSFVMAGLTMFLLSLYLTKSHVGSLIAGYIFTFSSFHFAHLDGGQLNLISLEWIPLFILCWFLFIQKPTIFKAFISAFVLFLVILCDYYFFFYCVLLGFIMFLWFGIFKKQKRYFLKKENLTLFILFVFIVALSSGILVSMLIYANITDPFYGIQPAMFFSADLLGLFIPGAHWRFSTLTASYWMSLPGNISENDVYLGWSVIIMLIYVWVKRKKLRFSQRSFFFAVILIFFIFSLGPVLHIWGRETMIALPYTILWFLVPLLNLSDVPSRMVIIVVFSSAILFAAGIKDLLSKGGKFRIFGIFLVAFLIGEYLPKPITLTQVAVPEYIYQLRNLPNIGGVLEIDETTDPSSLPMYYQTIHNKPIAFGYISRIPESVKGRDDYLEQLIQQKDWRLIYYVYDMRYVIFTDKYADCHLETLKLKNKDVKLYKLEPCF